MLRGLRQIFRHENAREENGALRKKNFRCLLSTKPVDKFVDFLWAIADYRLRKPFQLAMGNFSADFFASITAGCENLSGVAGSHNALLGESAKNVD